jgi:hypothetical protein
VHAVEHRGQEDQEANVLMRRRAGLEQVRAVESRPVGGNGHGPIAVLARAVDPGERLLVHDRLEPVPERDLLEGRHHQLVVVDGDVGLLEERRHLELRRRDLVVPRRDRDAELVELMLHLGDARLHALRNSTEVVILELLPARRRRADQRAAGHDEIRAHREMAAVDDEVLLLGPERRVDAVHAGVAEQLEQRDRAIGQHVGAAEQRRHLVECDAVVPDEHGWDAERARPSRLEDEHRAGGVPRRVATGLPGGAEAAGGEARSVRLALDQLRAAEALDGLPVLEGEKGVVLLGRESRLRLEPVTEMGHAVRDRPLLDGLGHRWSHFDVELLPHADGIHELGVDVARQPVAHLARAEGVDPEVLRGRRVPVGLGDRLGDPNAASGDLFEGREPAVAVERGRGHEGGSSRK